MSPDELENYRKILLTKAWDRVITSIIKFFPLNNKERLDR